MLNMKKVLYSHSPCKPEVVVSLSKNINPSLVLVQPRKACPFITERMGRKESNQTNNKSEVPCSIPGFSSLSDKTLSCAPNLYMTLTVSGT